MLKAQYKELLATCKFKLECYSFRVLNVTPMGTTNKTAIEYIQKEMRKEFKHFTAKKSTKHKKRQ